MQTKDDKYIGAVERNIVKAEKNPKYKGLTLDQAKMKIGIRNSDDSYDVRIKKLTK